MLVYIGGPLRISKYRNQTLYETIAGIISELGFEPYIPHIQTAVPDEKVDEKRLYDENVGVLSRSSFGIFEVTHPSHGVGMEIQHALLHKIPFLCVAKEGAIISKMVKGSTKRGQLVWYSSLEELKMKLKRKIRQELHLTETHNSGKFITVEGIDFTGKSTICQRIKGALSKQKWNVILVSDPPLIQPWRDLKQFFETQRKTSKFSEAVLLLSARLDNYERVIKPALKKGHIVISDRYTDSWFAYQSHSLKSYFDNNTNDAIDFLLVVDDLLFRNCFLSLPDLTILIVDEPEETLTRAKLRNNLSKYEELETQKAVQDIYLKIAKRFSSRFRIINAKGKDIDSVFREAYDLFANLLRTSNNAQQTLLCSNSRGRTRRAGCS